MSSWNVSDGAEAEGNVVGFTPTIRSGTVLSYKVTQDTQNTEVQPSNSGKKVGMPTLGEGAMRCVFCSTSPIIDWTFLWFSGCATRWAQTGNSNARPQGRLSGE